MEEPQKRPGVTFFSSFRSDRLWTLLGVKYEGGREGGASTALNCFMGEMRTTANPVNWHISVSSSLCAVMNFMREGGGCIVRPCAGGGVYWVWVGGLEIGTSLSLSLRLTHGSL